MLVCLLSTASAKAICVVHNKGITCVLYIFKTGGGGCGVEGGGYGKTKENKFTRINPLLFHTLQSLKEPEISCSTFPPFLMIPISPKALQPPPAFPQNVAETACEDTLVSLSSEMIEIAVDMMARYTFSSSLTQPKR